MVLLKRKLKLYSDENIGSDNFDFVISGDDLKEGQGKPDPCIISNSIAKNEFDALRSNSS